MKKIFSFMFVYLFTSFLMLFGITINASRLFVSLNSDSYGIYNATNNKIDITNENLTFDLYNNSKRLTAEYSLHNSSEYDTIGKFVFPVGKIMSLPGEVKKYDASAYFDSEEVTTNNNRILQVENDNIESSLASFGDGYVQSRIDPYNIYVCVPQTDFTRLNIKTYNANFTTADSLESYDTGLVEVINYKTDFFVIFAKNDNFYATVTNENGKEVSYTKTKISKFEYFEKYICPYPDLYKYYNYMDVYNLLVNYVENYYSIEDAVAAIKIENAFLSNSNHTLKVTTELLPKDTGNYDPPVYDVIHHVTSAATFNSFKNLNITVNTDMNILNSNIELNSTDDKSFSVHYDNLLDENINIQICSIANPQPNLYTNSDMGTVITMAIIILLIFLFMLFLMAITIGKNNNKLKNNKFLLIELLILLLASTLGVILTLMIYNSYTNTILGILLLATGVVGAFQLMLVDRKLYKTPVIFIDVIILGLIAFTAISTYLNLLNGLDIVIIIAIYIFNFAYLFFKSKLLINKENNEM